ncbi:hypothetical protein U91I_00246 [alpha proteobacterium U9-1i]|nr:hypothetical protein U91I_00246 [alpha proteobacterium U9-1i]
MAKTDLGEKQICPNCGAKFYDLRRRPAVCPKCTTSFDPVEEGVRAKRGRGRVAAHDPAYEDDDEEAAAKAKKKGEGDDDDEEAEEETAEVDVEADAEVLVSDDEDDDTVAKDDDEIPEGFSEGEADLEDDAADDDSVPLLEDEEEFPEDEIGEIPASDDDER